VWLGMAAVKVRAESRAERRGGGSCGAGGRVECVGCEVSLRGEAVRWMGRL